MLFGTIPKDTLNIVNTGIYITDLYDFDMINSSFSVNFWFWQKCGSKKILENDEVEFVNAKEKEILFEDIDAVENKQFWKTFKSKAIIKQKWDVTKYPFDKHQLEIILEDGKYSSSDLKYKYDYKNSILNDHLKLGEWEINLATAKPFERKYPSNFGDGRYKNHSSYSGLKVQYEIGRKHPIPIFFKNFTGLFIAFLIALFSLKIHISEADARFGACVGGLFASIGNMYIVNDKLPNADYFTLFDKLHILTFILIFVIFCISFISLKKYKQNGYLSSKKLDNKSFTILSIIYIFNLLFIIIL